MKKIVFFETTAAERAALKRFKPRGCAVSFVDGAAEAGHPALRDADIVSVFIYSRLDAAALKGAPKLKLIATRSTGFDHIDLKVCRRRDIPVSNVPHYGENTVAEHTFALILALSRKVHQAYIRTIHGDFSFEGLQGFDLKDKTLGVIGTGHIGLHVVRIGKGFSMNVIAYDVKPNPFMAETLGFAYRPFDEVLSSSDILSLHAPYATSTHHLINSGNVTKIKRGALLINTARGGLVETDALTRALDEGILAGAGLDTLEGENFIKEERQVLSTQFPLQHLKTMLQNHILLNRENVVITPHIAFNSREAFLRILETTTDNIQAFLAGRPENVIAV